ncbi:TPA: thymidine phosphorylase [candidate division WOR-3 bacterium]|uniref:Thymidine phosphorylase n=1 Tax=candidate division WOR-3 bacterium TaxID=2052148 RepID=A0A350H9M0_UNCW3|nr:thymidine phosphorylase [candidate division WOR-3 bacterium]
MNAPEIIRKKRDNLSLNENEIKFMIEGYVKDNIPDYQMSAFLMASFINNLNDSEILCLTKAMIESGDVYDFSDIEGIKVDKHSTGGVGDKVSIPLAPILASLGFFVPMVSGRGLGHTGGTLDKLESIKGFNVNLTKEKFRETLIKNKVAMGGQTETFVPADKKLYALRDVTGTVESIPLITASIMSKKLAEGIDSLFLDVKTGSGAFMKSIESAKELADRMFELGEMMGKKMAYVISDMSQPLGDYAGNGCEIFESVSILKGETRNYASKLVKETALMIMRQNYVGKSDEERENKYRSAIDSGKAYEKFLDIVRFQGGDEKSLRIKDLMYEKKYEIKSERDGYLFEFDTYKIGIALIYLNAGRFRKEDAIDHKAGIKIEKHLNEHVMKGEPIFSVYADKDNDDVGILLKESFKISQEKGDETKLIKVSRGA